MREEIRGSHNYQEPLTSLNKIMRSRGLSGLQVTNAIRPTCANLVLPQIKPAH